RGERGTGHGPRCNSATAVRREAERAEQQRHVIVSGTVVDRGLDLDDGEEPGAAMTREVRAGLEANSIRARRDRSLGRERAQAPVVVGDPAADQLPRTGL